MPPLRQQRGRETLMPLPPSKKNPNPKSKDPYGSQMEASLPRTFPGQRLPWGFGALGGGAGRGASAPAPLLRRAARLLPRRGGSRRGLPAEQGEGRGGGEAGLGGYLCVKDCQGWKDENLLCSPRAPNFLPSRQLAGFL